MRKLIPAALLVLCSCATSSDAHNLQSQIRELQDQLAAVKRSSAGKDEVQSVNQKIADQTAQLLKSNATLVAKVDPTYKQAKREIELFIGFIEKNA